MWRTATLRIRTAGCPAAEALHGRQLACLIPASPYPIGWMDGRVPIGWEELARQGERSLARWTNMNCGGCPMREWPEALPLLGVEVDGEGLVARVLFQEAGDLTETFEALKLRGHQAEILSCSPKVEAPSSVTRLLDLSEMTPRQREVLLCAARIGYFESGSRASTRALAQALGCSPATANEHLRKALSKLSMAWAAAEGTRPKDVASAAPA